MGAKQTKGQVLTGPSQEQKPQEPPYYGPSAQYHFINTEVTVSSQMTFSFVRTPMVTSNIDTYYPTLAAQYNAGYRLLSFYGIPGQQRTQSLFSPSVALGFQGIFCRYPDIPQTETWQLRVEKSVIQLQHMYNGIISFNRTSGVVTDTSHLMESIARNTQEGGRLICIELTGQQHQQHVGMTMQGFSPLMGVDLFYEIPTGPISEHYTYNCVCVPILVTVEMGFQPRMHVHCDWLGVLANSLNQGWRLIEIFMDKSQQTTGAGFTGQASMNSMWFFEKPTSRMNDPTPVYQGTVIDHKIKISAGFAGSHTSTKWEPVIQEMGNKGWELACILEIPDSRVSGLGQISMTCKLFFQRPILAQPQPAGLAQPAPPSYDAAVGGQPQGALPEAGFNVGPPSVPEKGY